MYVYWKPLLLLGILFWVTLFTTDVLRRHKILETFIPGNFSFTSLLHHHGVEDFQSKLLVTSRSSREMDSNLYLGRKIEIKKEYQQLEEIELNALHHFNEPPPIFASTKTAIVDKKKSTPSLVLEATSSETLGSDMGPVMIVLNIGLFVVSIVFCSIAKFVTSIFFKNIRKSEVAQTSELLKSSHVEPVPIGDTTNYPNPPKMAELLKKTSSSNTELKQSANQICQTIFHTTTALRHDQELRAECCKLREEVLILQSNSMKEHAVMTRKLEALAKERRELTKRSSVLLKENNFAKTEIVKIMEEKKQVQKRLDNATKELTRHLKTKKMALARLEETNVQVDDLKRQLQQVTRDKEILQEKLRVLRDEYESMQERITIMQLKETNRIIHERNATLERITTPEIEKAEKDENVVENINIEKSNEDLPPFDCSQMSLRRGLNNESGYLPYVISQTEIDLRKIQKKILQLEQSLKKFGTRTDIARSDKDAEQDTKTTDNKFPEEAEKLVSSIPKVRTPREDQTSNKSYDEMKLKLLRSALKEKIKILESLKRKRDEFTGEGCLSGSSTLAEEEFDLFSEDTNSSPRLVSNSQAFQRFLKNIGAETMVVEFGDAKLNTECK